ncbi:pentapeptide repeat-containing protein [Acaryochloris sp. IP29b_bin.148]|uniref:pentapeptide repeat-containing protein n=1 Tax=Acaryochloris sp. IP29b_bin.148 TaxID=2969218 RepID=UPI00262D4F80|nr:pentapeptide repeat-containing protein [Acaryochloris sp. IP29b_bin.148]
MANREHLNRLNQGVRAWNQWRDANPNIRPDLQLANLNGKNLSKINLSRADLSGADLSGTELRQAHLIGTNLSRAFMRWADLSRATLRGAYLWGADLSGTTLEQVDLSYAKLRGATLRWADLSFARLTQANLRGATLSGATLCRSILRRADCTWTELRWADMRGANLYETDLRWADMRGTDLKHSSLDAVIAIATDFTGATFTGASIENWKISNDTKLEDVECGYIYLKSAQRGRHPLSGDFIPGEFRNLVQKSWKTIDLIFVDGIDWLAFVAAFQSLNTEFSQDDINIQALEKKAGGVFVIRLEVSGDANHEMIEAQAKQYYLAQLKAIERRYKSQLNATDVELKLYRQKSAEIKEITKLLAVRPIKLQQQSPLKHRSNLRMTS